MGTPMEGGTERLGQRGAAPWGTPNGPPPHSQLLTHHSGLPAFIPKMRTQASIGLEGVPDDLQGVVLPFSRLCPCS